MASEDHTLDRELFNMMKNDDEVAFRALFDKYYVPLCRYAGTFVRDQGSAEEIVIDLFTSLWSARGRFECTSSVRHYLFRSVRNRSLNHLRDTRDRFLYEELSDNIYGDDGNDWLEIEQLEYFIQEAILSLPEKCREIFVKSRTEGKSHAEIATEAGISIKTVENQISKAIRRIKMRLHNTYR